MPSVLTKMYGDAVRPGLLADDGGRDDTRLDRFASFANGRDVIDIDVKFRGHLSKLYTPFRAFRRI